VDYLMVDQSRAPSLERFSLNAQTAHDPANGPLAGLRVRWLASKFGNAHHHRSNRSASLILLRPDHHELVGTAISFVASRGALTP
jgi:hypothetical protein